MWNNKKKWYNWPKPKNWVWLTASKSVELVLIILKSSDININFDRTNCGPLLVFTVMLMLLSLLCCNIRHDYVNINMTVKTSKRPQFVRSKSMFISLLLSIIKTSLTDFEAVSRTQFLGFGQLYIYTFFTSQGDWTQRS